MEEIAKLDPSILKELRFVEFQKIKKKVLKKFPDAKTQTDSNGNFYVIDKVGYKIIPEYLMIPNNDDVFGAWKNVAHALWTHHLLKRNKKKFSKENEAKEIIKSINADNNNLADFSEKFGDLYKNEKEY